MSKITLRYCDRCKKYGFVIDKVDINTGLFTFHCEHCESSYTAEYDKRIENVLQEAMFSKTAITIKGNSFT